MWVKLWNYQINLTNELRHKYQETHPDVGVHDGWCSSIHLITEMDSTLFELPKLLGWATGGFKLQLFEGIWVGRLGWGYTCDNAWGRGAEATLLPPPQSSSSCSFSSFSCQPSPPDAPQGHHPPPLTGSCLFSDLPLRQQSFLTASLKGVHYIYVKDSWEIHIDDTSVSTGISCFAQTLGHHRSRKSNCWTSYLANDGSYVWLMTLSNRAESE